MITNISNAYIGDASISRIYQGEELVYENSHPDILLEYICTGSANHIGLNTINFDTSIQFSKDIKIETKCLPWGGHSIIGMIGGWTYCPYYGLAYDLNNNGIRFYCGSHDGNGVEYSVFKECEEDVRIITTYFTDTNICMTVDGDTIVGDAYTSLPVFPGTISLFSNGGGPESKIYYFKIWENNNLVRFYIPVLHWFNGYYVPCFYDKVNDTYVYSDWFNGRGFPENFNHLAYPSTIKMTGDYLLDYIANGPDSDSDSAKDMYFDSSVLANANTRCEMKTAIPAYKGQWFCGGCTTGFIGFEIGVSAYHKPYTRIGSYLENGQNTYSNDIQLDVPYTIVLYHDGTNQKTIFNTEVATSTSGNVNAGSFPSTQTVILFARGLNGTIYSTTSYSGMKIYYTNFASGNIPSKSYIPVFHNNQAAFLDLNSGTYIYNIGTSVPYYQFKS